MKTLKLNSILFILFIITFNSCKKEDTPGPAGKDGSSNVSATVFSATTWFWSAPYHYINLNVLELTSDNINSAAVMVYFKTSNSWIAVPYTQYNSPYDYFMGFSTSTGKVQVTWVYDSSLSNGDNPNTYYGTTVQFKVVVIPPAIIKLYPNIDLNNYSDVKKAFKLKD